jgi:uncharacterized protein GlcG (DUF336 family)/quercetin dioxygenase-like cupin family protein
MKLELKYGPAALALALACGLARADGPEAPKGTSVLARKTLTLAGARKVIAAAAAEAKRANSTGAIAVVDDGGNLLALERLDGTFPAGGNISIGKARTAALFQRPTKVFEEIIAKGRTSMVALPDFTPLQGGVPIVAGGEVVGAIGVSGATSAGEDEEIAQAGARGLAEMPAPAGEACAAPVAYFEEAKVSAAFARGAVLFNQDPRFMIHASRREAAGLAEVHDHDIDVIYVLDGKATLVTGGKVLEGKATDPGEIRGKEIQGGETRSLSKGDVIIVPAGTPHWFKEVPAPLKYYVVKVRSA